MKYILKTGFIAGVIVWIGAGCGRDAPPDVPEYKIPPAIVFEESAVPEPAPLSGAPAAAPRPVPRPMPAKVQVPVPVEQKVVAPVMKAEASGPSLIGSWRITEMIVKGQAIPMPAAMQMTLTFAEGGSVTMSVSGGQMPQGKTEQGTYTLTGEQFTMTIHNDTKSGTCRFEGTGRATLDMGEAKMVLTRM
jgi:hypothetical protein